MSVAGAMMQEQPVLGSFVQARALIASGRVDEGLEAMDRAFESAPTVDVGPYPAAPLSQHWVLILTARELRAHGHEAEALRVLDRAQHRLEALAPPDSLRAPVRLLTAEVRYLMRQWEAAQAILSELSPEELNTPDWIRLYSITYSGVLAARLGDTARARSASAALAAQFTEGQRRLWATYGRARIAAVLGDPDAAVAALSPPGFYVFAEDLLLDVHSEMDFEPLRGLPEFRELLRPKGEAP